MNFTEGQWRSLIDNEPVRTARLGSVSSVDTDQLNANITNPFDGIVYEIQTPIEGLSDGDAVETWPASIGSPDGQGTKLTYSEGAFDGIDAVSADGPGGFGQDDPVLNIDPGIVDVIFEPVFSWLMTIQSNNDGWRMGYIDGDTGDQELRVEYDDGTLEFDLRGTNDIGTLRTTSISADIELDDGAVRTIVFNRTAPPDGGVSGGDEWEIWAGEQGGEISQLETEIEPGFEESTSDTIPDNGVNLLDALDGSMSQFALADETFSEDQIQVFHELALPTNE